MLGVFVALAVPSVSAWAVEIEGKAVVAAGRARRALPVLAPVFAGETVTGSGRLRLADGRLLTVSREQPWKAPPIEVRASWREAWAYAARAWEARREPIAEGGLRAVLPFGPVLGGRVGFWWDGAAGVAAEVEVLEWPIGTSQWRQAGFAGGHAVYPGTAPRLWPGKMYRWRVRVPDRGESEREFSIVETSDAGPVIAAVNGIDDVDGLGDEERWLLRSAALQARGFFMEGLEELRRFEAPLPPLAEALRRRAWSAAR